MRARRRVIVVGAGLGGLRAGWELARAGHEIIILERKNHPGGRAGSAPDPETGEPVDTGQHIFMGCYRETRGWFKALGTADRLSFQPRMEVSYLRAAGPPVVVKTSALPPPFHLLGAAGLSAARIAKDVLHPGRGLDRMTVREWEDARGIPADARETLFDPLAIAALNELPETASALPFVVSLQELARTGNAGCVIGFATAGLGETYVSAAGQAIMAAGGSLRVGAWATRLLVRDGAVRGVRLADGTDLEADAVISTVPPWDLVPLLEGVAELASLRESIAKFQPSPIVTVHLWLDRPVHPGRFSGFLDGAFHWVFNRSAIVGGTPGGREHLCLVKSGARDLLGKKPDELAALAREELNRFLPASRPAMVERARTVWETKATVSLTPGTDALRPSALLPLPGLALAGDWVQTGLPATIESAVKSGGMAARALVSSLP